MIRGKEWIGYVSSLLLSKCAKWKSYKTTDAVSAYCTQFKKEIPFTPSNPSNVSSNMESKHKDLMEEYEANKKKCKKVK